jgi:hypothetical protein
MLVALFVALVVAGVGYYDLSRRGALLGITEYDDGVYFGAAVRLVHGVVPYRDFVFVQPPGLPLLLTPAAAASYLVGTRTALAAARLLMPLVLAGEVLLTGRIVRHRGTVATLVACAVVGILPDTILAGHTVLTEPLLNLFCLLGVALAFEGDALAGSRRLIYAGLAIGFAGTVKLWAAVPALVIAVLCVPRWRRVASFVAGAAGGFIVPLLPFVVMAPGNVLRQIVLAQAQRANDRVPLVTRLRQLLSLSVSTSGPFTVTALEALAVFAVVAAFVGIAYALPGRRTRLDAFAIGALVLVAAILDAPTQFYYHYGAFLAPFLGLTLGLATSRYASSLRGLGRSPATVRVAGAGVLAALMLATAGLGAYLAAALARPYDDLAPLIDRVVPAGSCIVADSPIVLVTTNRFVPAGAGCAPLVDPTGTWIADNGGKSVFFPSPRLVSVWSETLDHADWLVLAHSAKFRVPFSGSFERQLQSQFRLVTRRGGFRFYVRRDLPHGNG